VFLRLSLLILEGTIDEDIGIPFARVPQLRLRGVAPSAEDEVFSIAVLATLPHFSLVDMLFLAQTNYSLSWQAMGLLETAVDDLGGSAAHLFEYYEGKNDGLVVLTVARNQMLDRLVARFIGLNIDNHAGSDLAVGGADC
jgi:hypothetical protein